MKMQRKFYDALVIIRDECRKHETDGCKGCALHHEGLGRHIVGCKLGLTPLYMDLNGIVIEKEKAEKSGEGNSSIPKVCERKPKHGEVYYGFTTSPFDAEAWRIECFIWGNTPRDLAFLEKGWVYFNCKDAETALRKVAERLGIEYEL